MRKRSALSFRDTGAAADWEKREACKCLVLYVLRYRVDPYWEGHRQTAVLRSR